MSKNFISSSLEPTQEVGTLSFFSIAHHFLGGLLVGTASALWSCLSEGMRIAATKGWFKTYDLGVRVLSVGNIQVGGAGKTPLVIQIAQEAHLQNLKTCILIRGYGGEWESSGGGVIWPQEPSPPTQLCGDEAALLHEFAPDAVIGVGLDRYQVFKQIKSHLPIDLVILDDSFQHWKIKKDLEVVALTSARRTEILYRDWKKALQHADLLVWTKGELRPDVRGRPLVKVRYQIPPPPCGPILLVTGVADGKSAFLLAKNSGYIISKHLNFPDHVQYEPSLIHFVFEEAEKMGCKVALTGKDWVKWKEVAVNYPMVVIEPKLIFEEGREIWDHVLWGSSSQV